MSCEHRNAVETLGVLTCVDCGAKRTSPERDEYITNTTRLITRRMQARGYGPEVLLDLCAQLVIYMAICDSGGAIEQLDLLDDREAMRALAPHVKRVQKMLAQKIARIPT